MPISAGTSACAFVYVAVLRRFRARYDAVPSTTTKAPTTTPARKEVTDGGVPTAEVELTAAFTLNWNLPELPLLFTSPGKVAVIWTGEEMVIL